MLSFSDLAPVIVALIAAGFVLLLTWHAWRQAHSAERGAAKAARRADRIARKG
jgi:hypothetical protein